MSYIGQKPAERVLTSADISDAAITTPKIANQAVNYEKLGAGTVLQVVQASYSTPTTTSSASYVDTGLSASITPKFSTSKILVMVHHTSCYKETNNTNLKLQLVRGSTVIALVEQAGGYTATSTENNFGSCSLAYLDSPATTSSTTYKTQMRADNGATVGVQRNSSVSSITLLEIAV